MNGFKLAALGALATAGLATAAAAQSQVDHQPADRKSTPSELQSRRNLVCRLLLEKKKTTYRTTIQ